MTTETERVFCSNPAHPRPVAAFARLFWPGGHYEPATACVTDLADQVRRSLDEGTPVEAWPITRIPDRAMGWGRWRRAPDCDRCKDTGRFRETNAAGGTTEAHCGCKRGRRMAELWYAEREGHYHPDAFEPSEPPDPDGPPF